jgi:hypothetical protein
MSNVDVTAPKQRVVGRPFPKGVSGNPRGRPIGARSRLSQDFLLDLHNAWSEHGADALARCAKEEPGRFCQIVAGLMPRDVVVSGSVDIGIDAGSVLQNFRRAVEMLGNDPERLPKPMKVIDVRQS